MPETAEGKWENPLIPNKKLRAIYTAMVELRLLEESLASRGRRTKSRPAQHAHGQEGCRVSTAIDLKPGDLTSEATPSAATAYLRGAKLSALIGNDSDLDNMAGSLTPLVDAAGRLYLAMGAALALRSKKPRLLTVAYVDRAELALPEWKPILRFAAAHALPIVFVVQSRTAGAKKTPSGQLSLASSGCGVPGIPVDAADPVALYRVAQESILRARAGGGPVLMECIPYHVAGTKPAPGGPITTMRHFLLHRGIVSEAWMQGVEDRFRTRLKSATP